MPKRDLGRVQGASIFYTSASLGTSDASVSKSTLTPTDLSPFVGDKILSSNGYLFNIIGVGDSTLTIEYLVSLHG